MLYRIYIGSNNVSHILEVEKAVQVISQMFEGFTIMQGQGYWKGKSEDSLIAEIEEQQESKVVDLCKKLAGVLRQEAVGLAKIGEMQFISI